MKTYTTLRNLYGDLTFNNSTSNLTFGDTLINNSIKRLIGSRAWPFMYRAKTIKTVADQQSYKLPFNFLKLRSAVVDIDGIKYTPKKVIDIHLWNRLNYNSDVTSNIPEYYFINDGTIGFYPKPSSSDNDIILTYRARFKDLSRPDYTTGTILTATNGSATVVGSGTGWTNKMNGRFLRITDADTVNTGDGEWYEIETVNSATNITLVNTYDGISISVGSASHTIGEVSPLPEGYDDIPVYEAASIKMKKIDKQLSQLYKLTADEKKMEMKNQFSGFHDDIELEEDGYIMENPNFYIMR